MSFFRCFQVLGAGAADYHFVMHVGAGTRRCLNALLGFLENCNWNIILYEVSTRPYKLSKEKAMHVLICALDMKLFLCMLTTYLMSSQKTLSCNT